MFSSGIPRTVVVHVSPALTGIASVSAPVEKISPGTQQQVVWIVG
jgi:hypothetical protein